MTETLLKPGSISEQLLAPGSAIEALLQSMRAEELTSNFIGEEIIRTLDGKSGKIITTDKKTRMNKEVSRFHGLIQAELGINTEIRSNSGDTLLGSDIGVYEATGSVISK